MEAPPAKSPRVIAVDRENPDTAILAEAAAILRQGGLVAFPTETVYGLGARALATSAIQRIFQAKGRPPAHPIIAHVLGEGDAQVLAAAWSPLASRLARAFWPGPLTIIAPKKNLVPRELTGGGDTVGIRAPAHPVARALIAAFGEPIAAPSANRYQEVSPTRAAHVVKSLGASVDLVLDGGPCDRGIESTVVSLEGDDVIRVLRPGSVSLRDLRAYGKVIYEAERAEKNEARRSPGLDAKHYAPKARVVLASRDAILAAAKKGDRAAVIFLGEKSEIEAFETRVLAAEPTAFARGIFATLHELDDLGCDLIVIETPPDEEAWIAVRDRLSRAKAD